MLAIITHDAATELGSTLHRIQQRSGNTLRLAAVKWLPRLETSQAKDVTPYEVGHMHWRTSIEQMCAAPVALAVMRGTNAFATLRATTRDMQVCLVGATCVFDWQQGVMMAPNDAETYRHICSFFADSELGCVPPNFIP